MPNLNRVTGWIVSVVLVVCSSYAGEAVSAAEGNRAESGTAEVNGVQIYYEIHGEGEPLLLLHGGLGCTNYWSEQIPTFSRVFRVVAMDSRGHGRSTFDETPISYDLMTRDVIGLMDHLEIEKANVVGWSDGGIIGLNLALNYRERVHKVVAFGANFNHTGVRADFMENPTFVGYLEKATTDYQEMSPAPERWDEFMANIGNTWASEPNFSTEQLGSITAPVLVVTGVNEEVIDEQHTSVHTLRNWEQGRRSPEGPALALLRVAARHPGVLRENLAVSA